MVGGQSTAISRGRANLSEGQPVETAFGDEPSSRLQHSPFSFITSLDLGPALASVSHLYWFTYCFGCEKIVANPRTRQWADSLGFSQGAWRRRQGAKCGADGG